jgi:hypothetical protein
VWQKKEFGGLGVHDFRELNLCLLASWIKRYTMADNKLWKQTVDHKYDTNKPNILWTTAKNISPFWKGVVWAVEAARMGYRWNISNVKMVNF